MMWVDICDRTAKKMPEVDIKPRKPVEYELRVIVWNCEQVPLTEDSILLGMRSSDIRFQGWLEGYSDKSCKTDVHYRSVLLEEGKYGSYLYPIIIFDHFQAFDVFVHFTSRSLVITLL